MGNDGFTRKKVESLTLGEKLRKLRSDFRMSLADVSKATRVQVKYWEFLENGQYNKLPAEVYVRGFLRSYARYLNIDEQALVRLYERERHIQKNLGHEQGKSVAVPTLSPSSIILTSRSIVIGLIVLLTGGAFLYLYQEFKSFAANPQLVILEPNNNALVEEEAVMVRGKTDKGAQVFLNNQSVYVDEGGLFSDKLFVQPGINTIQVRTVNRFEKEKTVTVSVDARYVPAETASDIDQTVADTPSESFFLEVMARRAPVAVNIVADETVVFHGSLLAGETKKFEAKERIVITSDRGEATFIRMNGLGEGEALTEMAGPVKDIIFLKSGKQE